MGGVKVVEPSGVEPEFVIGPESVDLPKSAPSILFIDSVTLFNKEIIQVHCLVEHSRYPAPKVVGIFRRKQNQFITWLDDAF